MQSGFPPGLFKSLTKKKDVDKKKSFCPTVDHSKRVPWGGDSDAAHSKTGTENVKVQLWWVEKYVKLKHVNTSCDTVPLTRILGRSRREKDEGRGEDGGGGVDENEGIEEVRWRTQWSGKMEWRPSLPKS
jgi:hypothetical protein